VRSLVVDLRTAADVGRLL